YLTEDDVAALLTPADALEAVEESFLRLLRGAGGNPPRAPPPPGGRPFAGIACVASGPGSPGRETHPWGRARPPVPGVLFSRARARLEAVIEADTLGRLRTGAASGVAARHLARPGARTLGVIGCGWQAGSQIACIRGALPDIDRVVVHCRNAERLAAFCR